MANNTAKQNIKKQNKTKCNFYVILTTLYNIGCIIFYRRRMQSVINHTGYTRENAAEIELDFGDQHFYSTFETISDCNVLHWPTKIKIVLKVDNRILDFH
jgi:hypothetical protein